MFSLATTAVVLLVSSMAGYALSRLHFPGRRAFLGSVLLLHSFPSVTLLIATFIVLRQLGLYDQLLGVILVKAAFELPLGIWIMKGFFDTVPWELEMAALVDGAGRITTWWRVVMPLVRPGLLALGLLAFVSGWNEFLLPFVFMPSGIAGDAQPAGAGDARRGPLRRLRRAGGGRPLLRPADPGAVPRSRRSS